MFWDKVRDFVKKLFLMVDHNKSRLLLLLYLDYYWYGRNFKPLKLNLYMISLHLYFFFWFFIFFIFFIFYYILYRFFLFIYNFFSRYINRWSVQYNIITSFFELILKKLSAFGAFCLPYAIKTNKILWIYLLVISYLLLLYDPIVCVDISSKSLYIVDLIKNIINFFNISPYIFFVVTFTMYSGSFFLFNWFFLTYNLTVTTDKKVVEELPKDIKVYTVNFVRKTTIDGKLTDIKLFYDISINNTFKRIFFNYILPFFLRFFFLASFTYCFFISFVLTELLYDAFTFHMSGINGKKLLFGVTFDIQGIALEYYEYWFNHTLAEAERANQNVDNINRFALSTAMTEELTRGGAANQATAYLIDIEFLGIGEFIKKRTLLSYFFDYFSEVSPARAKLAHLTAVVAFEKLGISLCVFCLLYIFNFKLGSEIFYILFHSILAPIGFTYDYFQAISKKTQLAAIANFEREQNYAQLLMASRNVDTMTKMFNTLDPSTRKDISIILESTEFDLLNGPKHLTELIKDYLEKKKLSADILGNKMADSPFSDMRGSNLEQIKANVANVVRNPNNPIFDLPDATANSILVHSGNGETVTLGLIPADNALLPVFTRRTTEITPRLFNNIPAEDLRLYQFLQNVQSATIYALKKIGLLVQPTLNLSILLFSYGFSLEYAIRAAHVSFLKNVQSVLLINCVSADAVFTENLQRHLNIIVLDDFANSGTLFSDYFDTITKEILGHSKIIKLSNNFLFNDSICGILKSKMGLSKADSLYIRGITNIFFTKLLRNIDARAQCRPQTNLGEYLYKLENPKDAIFNFIKKAGDLFDPDVPLSEIISSFFIWEVKNAYNDVNFYIALDLEAFDEFRNDLILFLETRDIMETDMIIIKESMAKFRLELEKPDTIVTYLTFIDHLDSSGKIPPYLIGLGPYDPNYPTPCMFPRLARVYDPFLDDIF